MRHWLSWPFHYCTTFASFVYWLHTGYYSAVKLGAAHIKRPLGILGVLLFGGKSCAAVKTASIPAKPASADCFQSLKSDFPGNRPPGLCAGVGAVCAASCERSETGSTAVCAKLAPRLNHTRNFVLRVKSNDNVTERQLFGQMIMSPECPLLSHILAFRSSSER